MRNRELLLTDSKGRVAVGEAGDGVYGYRKTVLPNGNIVLEAVTAKDTPEHWMLRSRKANRKKTPRFIKRPEPANPMAAAEESSPLIVLQRPHRKPKVDSSERLDAAETLPSRKQRRLAKYSLAELVEQRRQARASLNPAAFKACKFLSATLKKGLPVLFLGFLGLLMLVGMIGGKLNQGEGALIGFMAAGVVGTFVLMGLARMILCALFFSRYSLSDMMYFLLSLNGMATLLAVFPSELKLLPALGLIYVVSMPFSYFLAQDPEGDDFLPPFIRQRMMEDRAKARARKRVEDQPAPQPEMANAH